MEMVATVLSAQCTDKRVNTVTPALFKKYKNPKAYAKADLHEIEDLVHSTGFYRAKARNIQALNIKLLEDFGGEVPRTLEELITLPGVGRKTANVVDDDANPVAKGHGGFLILDKPWPGMLRGVSGGPG